MEQTELIRAIEAILFAAGERVEISRLAAVLETDEDEIARAADTLADQLSFDRRGIRVMKLENGYQMVSSGEMADYITKALETRKPPKLSSSQLEALTIIAYYQPATKAMVEQIRGVDSSYSISALMNKKLIEEAGRLNVPGRPIQYRTTPDFLRTFAGLYHGWHRRIQHRGWIVRCGNQCRERQPHILLSVGDPWDGR
jgi:segregation and condensation protein B